MLHTSVSCNWFNSFRRVSFDALHFLGGRARFFPCMHVESQIQRECLFLPVPYGLTFGSAVELSQLPDLSLISLAFCRCLPGRSLAYIL